MWLLAALLSCTGPDRAPPLDGEADPPLTLSQGVPFAELELPPSSRSGEIPTVLALSGWQPERGTVAFEYYKAPLPIKLRALFFLRPPDGMRVLQGSGAEVLHRSVRGVSGERWRFGAESVTLMLPVGSPPPADGAYVLEYPLASQREARLNLEASGLDREAFVQAQLNDRSVTHAGLLLPAPATAAFDVRIPRSGELHFTPVVLGPETVDGPPSDGVEFVVEVDATGPTKTVWRQHVLPGTSSPAVVDLSEFGGQDVRLRLRSEPGATPRFDYALWGDPVVSSRKAKPKRAVLIFVDTQRPDHLGLYGYHRATSTPLDTFGAKAAVFEQARTVAPWTLPSSRALLTGHYPDRWGQVTTLQGELRQRGWATGFIAGNVYLSANFEGTTDWGYHFVQNWPGARDQVDRAKQFLAANEGRDTLLVVHFMDPHLPYREPAEYRYKFAGKQKGNLEDEFHRGHLAVREIDAETRDYVRDRYDNNVAYVHDELGRLFKTLSDDDLVIYFSDHGEEFWEHKRVEHGHSLFDELMHVPLVIRAPGIAPQRRTDSVSLIDITPTVLDWAGADATGRTGISLLPLMRDDKATATLLADRNIAMGNPLYGPEKWGVVANEQKWISYEGREAIYDLKNDPNERDNLVLNIRGDSGQGWRERLADALDREVLVGYRVFTSIQREMPTEDVVAEITVPGGIRAAWVGADPTGGTIAEVAFEGEHLVARWPKGWRGGREIFFFPIAPMAEVTNHITATVTLGDVEELLTIHPDRVPTLSKNRMPLGRVRFKETGRQVIISFATMPVPPPTGPIEGYDPELAGMLQAMGYAVGKDAPDEKPHDPESPPQ
jgi:arylsulfatase A-like enzyme